MTFQYFNRICLQVGNEGEGAEAKDFLYVDAFNGGKAMSCAEVMALVRRLVGNDVTLSDECMLAVPTLRQVQIMEHNAQII